MANWKFLQLERAMLVLRIVASSWHSLKIEKEDVNEERQRPHKVTKKNQKAKTNSADKLTNRSRKVKNLKKKEKEIEGDRYEEEEAVKEGNQTQQRGRVQMKLFFFFSYSKFCKCCYLYFLFYIFLQSHEVYRNNPIIYI